MTRPALSALRALDIIDLMAGQPAERFTLSDIVRLTGTNASSCHAVLAVMVQSGYLLREPGRKTYRLAPAVIAIGEAAARHDPVYAAARALTMDVAERTGMETLLTARAGGDIIGVARFAREGAMPASLMVGQRVPLRAPFGGLFYAWAGAEEAASWCASEGEQTSDDVRRMHENALQLLRERGFLLSLRSTAHGVFTRQLGAQGSSPYDSRLSMLLKAIDNGLYQPHSIDPDAEYRVQALSAPIFDGAGQVSYNVSINYLPQPVSGAALLDQANELVAACNPGWMPNGAALTAAKR